MKKRRKLWLALIIITILVTIASWLAQPEPDPIFHGRPESDWISGVRYYDDAQAKQWHEFGPEGVQVLIRGLDKLNHGWDRKYRETYRKTPRLLRRILPQPKPDTTHSKRMELVSLLSRLGPDAKEATPIMIETLRNENASVGMMAISFFTAGENPAAPLNQLDQAHKQELLPLLLAAVQSNNEGLRNNALIALRYYPNEQQTVTPAILPLLKDPKPEIRLRTVQTLYRVNPDRLVSSGGVTVALDILENPDPQLAHQGATTLGEMHKEPALVVPALLDAVRGTNSLVSSSAIRALSKFPEEAGTITPALQEILRGSGGNNRRSITNLLQKLEKGTPPSIGGK